MISCSHWGMFDGDYGLPQSHFDEALSNPFVSESSYDSQYLHGNAAQTPGWQSVHLNQHSAATNTLFQNYINPGEPD